MWVYRLRRKKGRCPKLDCHWEWPCHVVERLGEVVYRVQLSGKRKKVALHRDRDSLASPSVESQAPARRGDGASAARGYTGAHEPYRSPISPAHTSPETVTKPPVHIPPSTFHRSHLSLHRGVAPTTGQKRLRPPRSRVGDAGKVPRPPPTKSLVPRDFVGGGAV